MRIFYFSKKIFTYETQKLLKVTIAQKLRISQKNIIYAKNERQVDPNLPANLATFEEN